MKDAIGYRESEDGGSRHAHFEGDVLPKGWRLVEGEKVPGPDPEMVKRAEVQRRLQAELADLIIANPGADLADVVATRKAEIEVELTP